MIVRSATPADAGKIYELMDRSPRQRVHLGNEDVADAINTDRILLLFDESGHGDLLAFLITTSEERPSSLPPEAADRIFLRGMAFRQNVSPTTSLRHLLQAFVAGCVHDPRSRQLIAYGGEGWLDRALRSAGMAFIETVQYFELDQLHKRYWDLLADRTRCLLRNATVADLPPLAMMDGRTFDPIWHCSQRDLQELLLRGPMLVASCEGELVGYMSLLLEREAATIARLAVDRGWQGQGIGRSLLVAGLRIAQQAGYDRAILNTQATNQRSQQLYRSVGFSPTYQSFAVFALDVSGSAATDPDAEPSRRAT